MHISQLLLNFHEEVLHVSSYDLNKQCGVANFTLILNFHEDLLHVSSYDLNKQMWCHSDDFEKIFNVIFKISSLCELIPHEYYLHSLYGR